MKSTSDLFDRLGGVTKISQWLENAGHTAPIGTVSAWKTRNTPVPDEFRPALVDMARKNRVSGITLASITMIWVPAKFR